MKPGHDHACDKEVMRGHSGDEGEYNERRRDSRLGKNDFAIPVQ
jgi:hypothetical protein